MAEISKENDKIEMLFIVDSHAHSSILIETSLLALGMLESDIYAFRKLKLRFKDFCGLNWSDESLFFFIYILIYICKNINNNKKTHQNTWLVLEIRQVSDFGLSSFNFQVSVINTPSTLYMKKYQFSYMIG